MDFIGIIRVFKGNIALGSLLRRQKKAEAIDSTIQSTGWRLLQLATP